jgi:hypothetical protein
MNESPGWMIPARDFQEKKLTFESGDSVWIHNTEVRNYNREGQEFMSGWDKVIGEKAIKNNVRAKSVLSITRIYYDQEEEDVINVI